VGLHQLSLNAEDEPVLAVFGACHSRQEQYRAPNIFSPIRTNLSQEEVKKPSICDDIDENKIRIPEGERYD